MKVESKQTFDLIQNLVQKLEKLENLKCTEKGTITPNVLDIKHKKSNVEQKWKKYRSLVTWYNQMVDGLFINHT